MGIKGGKVSTDLNGLAVTDVLPAGVVFEFAGTSAPTGWLLCDGSAVSRTTYARLFAAISTTYGVGDGSTTFNLPDRRGRIAVGKDDMGGTAANRITSGGCGITGTTLGATGGAETHTLSTAQLPSHTHSISDSGHSHTVKEGTAGGAPCPADGTSGSPGGIAALTNQGTEHFGNDVVGGVWLQNTVTGITGTNSAGSGSAHNNVQPTIIQNFIIRT